MRWMLVMILLIEQLVELQMLLLIQVVEALEMCLMYANTCRLLL